ncbi:MAG: hypothetical protein ACI4MH_05930 [Candidatus Coproplasma sp.]
MKAIKRLIITLLVIVIVVAAAGCAGYFYVRSAFGIDLFNTVGQLRTLGEEVDEASLCPNAFSNTDMVDVQTEVNKSVEDLITYSEEHGYSVNFDNLPDEMKYIIKLTDKQVGALAQTVVTQEMHGKIEVSGKQLGVELKQVEFSGISDGNALFNAVVKVDLSSVKDEMSGFPFNLLKGMVPDNFYVSSTVYVKKGASAFSYSVEHRSLTVNNLSAADTEDLFHTLDLVLQIGSAESLNEEIGETFLSSLIGSQTKTGLAYSLKPIGASDYSFVQEGGIGYFVVERGSLVFLG